MGKNFEEDIDYFTHMNIYYVIKKIYSTFSLIKKAGNIARFIHNIYITFVLDIHNDCNDIGKREYIATRIEQTDVIKYLSECKFFFSLECKLLLLLLFFIVFFSFFSFLFFLSFSIQIIQIIQCIFETNHFK